MLNFLKLLLVVTAAVAVTAAKMDFCRHGDHTFKIGDTYSPPGECIIYICEGYLSMTGETCSSYEVLGDCEHIPVDNTKPYPDCCPKYKCGTQK